jgi:tetratricopeptide (TPR) repeat protein
MRLRNTTGFLLVCALASAIVLTCATTTAADDEGQGHKHHEALTEKQLGTVHFPVSCAASVEKPFERGVALLHSFWYEEAQKEFEGIAKDDPKCAMAHWGIAMSLWHQLWNAPDKDVVKKGQEQLKEARALHPPTERENAYIAALGAYYDGTGDENARAKAYADAMQKVYEKYPDDHEAAIFYALSLLGSAPDHDTTFANNKQAAAILEKLFATEPDHPGVAHYLIHAYDKPQLAELGLPAARRYAQVAPAAPHALHMPSHIFARVGDWQDDIQSNLASVDATRKTAAMHMGGEGHQFHAMDFLVYAYLQCGREADAWAVIEDVRKMPPMHDMYGLGFDPRTYALSKFPANYYIELHRWTDAAALEPVKGASDGDQAMTYWARAIGAARSGNVAQAKKDVAEIEKIQAALVAKKENMFADVVEDDHKEAQAWLLHAEGKNDEAVAELTKLAEKEEAEGREPMGMPAREMLGDMLMEMKKPAEALAAYQMDLKFNPKRFNGLYGAGQAAEAAGKANDANEYYADLVQVCAESTSERPELARAKGLVAKK